MTETMTSKASLQSQQAQITDLQIKYERLTGNIEPFRDSINRTQTMVEKIFDMLRGTDSPESIGVLERLRRLEAGQLDMKAALEQHLTEHKCESQAQEAEQKTLDLERKKRRWNMQDSLVLALLGFAGVQLITLIVEKILPWLIK